MIVPLTTFLIVLALTLVPILAYTIWLRRKSWEMKDKIAAWDPFIKVLAIIGAVVVGLASLEKYVEQRQQEIVKARLASEEAQHSAYTLAIRSASTVANADSLSGTEVDRAVITFWRLYWGELASYEGPEVESAMVYFGEDIQEWQKSGKKPQQIQQHSLEVARACRDELTSSAPKIIALKSVVDRLLGV